MGCDNAADKVACLREAPYEKIYEHMGTVNYFLEGYRSLASAWTLRPSPKDPLLPEPPDLLAKSGKIANVPLLMGDMKDEGPLFSVITALNTTTDEEVKDYFKTYWWPAATEAQLDALLEQYPQDPAAGSPYDTGIMNTEPGPQYKRIASIVGDYSFQTQRRQLFENYKAPIWSYQTEASLPLSLLDDTILGEILDLTGATNIPILGSFHAFDVLFYVFETLPAALSNNVLNIMTTWISFIHNLDPNQHDLAIPNWPQFNEGSKALYQFKETGPELITDTYRAAPMEFINKSANGLRI